MNRRWLIFIVLLSCRLVSGQTSNSVRHFDEEDGLPHAHITQLLQDSLGLMWFATWNGLCRYDGYEFRTFKSQAGDGCNMPTDRFRDIALRPDGKIICRVDDDFFLFDPRSCSFSDVKSDSVREAASDLSRYRQSRTLKNDNGQLCFTYTDFQGNEWFTSTHGIYKKGAGRQHTWRLNMQPSHEVRCLFVDNQQRCWVATREDAALRVYDETANRLLGYLGQDGRLHASFTSFGSVVYCMHQSSDGTIWLGTKPDGLYRLRHEKNSSFQLDHLTNLPNGNVYHMIEDRSGRLWVATLGGGLCVTSEPSADNPRFVVPEQYPKDQGRQLRYLCLADGGRVLLMAATDGLLVSKLHSKIEKMRFHRHQRESDRTESLSSSAVMDIVESADGSLYVGTESGGVNMLRGSLLSEKLSFSHFTVQNNLLPTDVVMSLSRFDAHRMMVVSGHTISVIDSSGIERTLDARFFNSDFRFSEAHPLSLGGGRWIFGLTDGAFLTTDTEMLYQGYRPKIVLTGISIQDGREDLAMTYTDTLQLHPGERSITVNFAAVDYTNSNHINYSFRLLPQEKWNHIGHNRSVTLLDLSPGTYHLEIRSTDAEGLWMENTRSLTIIVIPAFWESTAGHVTIFLILFLLFASIIFTILYIRRIKRHQRETLEAYLALLESGDQSTIEQRQRQPTESDVMLDSVMAFIEQNISNGDASIGDMAVFASTSRSGLQRKLKQTMGITPQELLREARIKHACKLLSETDKTVAEVAYACGFTDPKYFSRCFKQSMGLSPTEYKGKINVSSTNSKYV